MHWAKYFSKFLSYKQPYLINGACYHHIDDELDILDTYGSNEPRIMLDIMNRDDSEDFDSTDDFK